MKHDLKITTGVSTALLLASCGPAFDTDDGWKATENMAVCTDRHSRRVSDDNCSRGGNGNAFMWYYLHRGALVPAIGMLAFGGTYSPPPAGVRVTPSVKGATRIARGGFGSSARSSVGG